MGPQHHALVAELARVLDGLADVGFHAARARSRCSECPSARTGRPTFLVKPMMACLDAVYAAPAREPPTPATDATLTMLPLPFSIMMGSALRMVRIGPVSVDGQHPLPQLVGELVAPARSCP